VTTGPLSVLGVSFVVVALAEMGDKTQLVALSLASRYRRPWLVMLGILIATLANHALASSVGVWLAASVSEKVLAVVLGLGFVAFGVWTLFPDRAEEPAARGGWGPLLSTTVVFFLAEMGDKTQLATVALGARYGAPVAVTAGTTAGMLAADGLAVLVGSRLADVVPMRLVRGVAATLFFLFGAAALGRAVGHLG
jgi:putative Ca2+/H+ antiporter (TMEM165/GDT1 family)